MHELKRRKLVESQQAQEEEERKKLALRGLLCCPSPGCTRKFVKKAWLHRHVNMGDHRILLRSSFIERVGDVVFKRILESFNPYDDSTPNPTVRVSASLSSSSATKFGTAAERAAARTLHTSYASGWARIPWTKPVHRKSERVKRWLAKQFEASIWREGDRLKSAELAALMRTLRDEQGVLFFSPADWLSVKQIKAAFSWFKRKRQELLETTTTISAVTAALTSA